MKANAWISLLAYDGWVRHTADCRRNEEMVTRLAAARSRILADLRGAVAVDVEAFRQAQSGTSVSAMTCHDSSSAHGFVVSRTEDSIDTRRLFVDLQAASLSCRYDQCGNAFGGPSREREITIDIGNDGATLSLWDGGVVRGFTTVETLSTFLLAPLLGTC